MRCALYKPTTKYAYFGEADSPLSLASMARSFSVYCSRSREKWSRHVSMPCGGDTAVDGVGDPRLDVRFSLQLDVRGGYAHRCMRCSAETTGTAGRSVQS